MFFRHNGGFEAQVAGTAPQVVMHFVNVLNRLEY
jgi:hypothetical protein